MADFEEAIFNFPAEKLKLIDERVQRILAKCENHSREDILEELTNEFDAECLLEEREKCFNLAKERLLGQVQNGDQAINGDMDIHCVRRTGKSKKENIGKEILELFEYVVGYSQDFPRHLITKESKLVVSAEKSEKEQINISDKMMLIGLKNVVAELNEKMDKIVNENRAMEKRIKDLETEIDRMKDLKIVHESGNPTSSSSNSVQPSISTIAGENEGTNDSEETNRGENKVHKDSEQNDGIKNQANDNVNNESDSSSESSESDIQCAQPYPKRQRSPSPARYNIMDTNGIDWTTVIKKKSKNCSSNETKTAHQRQQDSYASRVNTRSQISQDPDNRPKRKATDSQMVKSSRYQGADSNRLQLTGSRRNRPTLRGIKQEKSTALYLKSIEVNEESDEEVGKLVKTYAESKGIRVMGFHVIRFKSCHDAVGVKIFVPEKQQNKAMDPDLWPSDITCRRWERPDVWKEKMRREEKSRWEDQLRDNDRWNQRNTYDEEFYYDSYRPH